MPLVWVEVITEPGRLGSTALTGVMASPSSWGPGAVTVASRAAWGRLTVTGTSTRLVSEPLVTVTGSLTTRSVSPSFQSSMVGVPVSSPWGLTAMPATTSPLMVEPGLLGSTTLVPAGTAWPSVWGPGAVTVASRAVGASATT